MSDLEARVDALFELVQYLVEREQEREKAEKIKLQLQMESLNEIVKYRRSAGLPPYRNDLARSWEKR